MLQAGGVTAHVQLTRVWGQTQYDTALAIAEQVPTVAVTRGNAFTDGLVGAVVSGTAEEPLLLTESPTTVGSSLTAFLMASGASGAGVDRRATCRITALVVLGGPLAVSTAAVVAMVADLGV